MATNISPLYLQIGKGLAEQLVLSYASVNPNAAVALTVVKNILDAQAAVAAHDAVIVKAQAEGWADTDPRWDAPLAEQQARMDAVNARLDAMT